MDYSTTVSTENQSTERTERRGQIYQFYSIFSLPVLSGSSFTPFHIFLRLKLLDHCSFVPIFVIR